MCKPLDPQETLTLCLYSSSLESSSLYKLLIKLNIIGVIATIQSDILYQVYQVKLNWLNKMEALERTQTLDIPIKYNL